MAQAPDIKALRAFVKVAELGNISHAALALGLTQSSLSRIVSALEKTLGGTLFYRTGRGVRLTEVGEAALPRARSIVINLDQLTTEVRDFSFAPSGTVTVALLPALLREIAGQLYEEVHRTHPAITLRMLEGFSGQIEEWLADGRADVGLLSRYKGTRAVGERVLTTSQLALVAAPGPAGRRRTVRFRELARQPLVLPAMPNALRMALEEQARRERIALRVVAEADSLEAQKAIIRRQDCRAVLGLDTVRNDVAKGLLRAWKIVDPMMPRLLVMSTTTQRPLSRATREVARIAARLAAPR